MLINLGLENSLLSEFVAEIRDITIQKDRIRFKRNLERVGEIFAYEISKKLTWTTKDVQTPLAASQCAVLAEQPVIGSVLRAGLPLQQGLLNFFDKADSAFISAYRKHSGDSGNFEIVLGYLACPAIQDKVLIICDPMLATGSSLVLTIQELLKAGKPRQLHIVSVIASRQGVQFVETHFPDAMLWTAAIDNELNQQAYIVPGLGDAGDLAFGEKIQH